MTWMNWVSIGVAAALIAAFVILKLYAKRKTDLYDGLGGIITRRRPPQYYPAPDPEPAENDSPNEQTP